MSEPTKNSEPSRTLIPVTDERDERADYIIGRYTLFGTGAGVLPYSGINVAALTAVQTRMIQELAELYDVDFSQSTVRLVAQNIVVSVAGQVVAGGVTRLIKSFGPLRYLLGGVTSAALSGALTAEIGQIYREHFERGGTLADITLEDIVQQIRKQIERGEFKPANFGGILGQLKYLRPPN